MGRWLPKGVREERDKKIIELYQSRLPCEAIITRLGLSGYQAIYTILKRHGITARRR